MRYGMFGLGAAAPEVARRIAEEQARKRLAGQTEFTSRNMDPLMGDGGFPLTRGGQDMRSKAAQQNWADMRSQLQARPAADRTTRFAGEVPAAATGSMLSDGAPMQPVRKAGIGSVIGGVLNRMPQTGMMGRGPSRASPNTASSLTSVDAPMTREQMAQAYNINVPNFGGTGPTLNSSGVPVMRSSEPLSVTQEKPRTPKQPNGMFGNGMYSIGGRDWWKEITSDPLGFLLTGMDGLTERRNEAYKQYLLEQDKENLTSYMTAQGIPEAKQYPLLMSEDPVKAIREYEDNKRLMDEADRLRVRGFTDEQVIAFLNNPAEFAKSLGTNLEGVSLTAGTTRYTPGIPGSNAFTAPVIGMDGGVPYRITAGDDGQLQTQFGDSRPPSYSDVTARINANKPPGSGSSAGSLTPSQRGALEINTAKYDQETENQLKTREANLTTVKDTLSLLDKFIADEDMFKAVYGNVINAKGEKTTFLDTLFGRWPLDWDQTRKDGMARVNQLSGQAFLQAIPQMKGTGALSENEGQKLTQAATRLAAVEISDEEAKTAAEEFRNALIAAKAKIEEDLRRSRAAAETTRRRLRAILDGPAQSSVGDMRAEDLTDEEIEAMLAGAGN